MNQVATHSFMECTLEFAEFVYGLGVTADEDMPIEPEGWDESDWQRYHNELSEVLDKANNLLPHSDLVDYEYLNETMEEIERASYCKTCGAEFGEGWIQCDCFDVVY